MHNTARSTPSRPKLEVGPPPAPERSGHRVLPAGTTWTTRSGRPLPWRARNHHVNERHVGPLDARLMLNRSVRLGNEPVRLDDRDALPGQARRRHPREDDSSRSLPRRCRSAPLLSGLTITRSDRGVPVLSSLDKLRRRALWHAAVMESPTTETQTRGRTRRRLAWERRAIAEASIAATVDAAEIDAWIDSIGTDQEVPPPEARR